MPKTIVSSPNFKCQYEKKFNSDNYFHILHIENSKEWPLIKNKQKFICCDNEPHFWDTNGHILMATAYLLGLLLGIAWTQIMN